MKIAGEGEDDVVQLNEQDNDRGYVSRVRDITAQISYPWTRDDRAMHQTAEQVCEHRLHTAHMKSLRVRRSSDHLDMHGGPCTSISHVLKVNDLAVRILMAEGQF